MVKITPEENDLFRQYIEKISGIHLGREKAYLLETRLAGLLEEEGCTSFLALYHKTESINGHVIQQKIIDRISTNETLFSGIPSPLNCFSTKFFPISSMQDVRALPAFSRRPFESGAPPVQPVRRFTVSPLY